MANAGSCVPMMEIPCFSITTSPESPTLLYTSNTRKGHTGRLASFAPLHRGQFSLNRHGRRHCGTWAEQPRLSSQLAPRGSEIGTSLGTDARVIPTVDKTAALVRR